MSDTGQRGYVPAIDWMKATAIFLVVHGHVAARTVEWATPPFYPKQIGVALFIFAMGYTLARERKPTTQVLFNR
jgi:peptidoglycan/LPS O-acetylase OafA/YrhL